MMPRRRVLSFLQTLEALGETAWYRNLQTDQMRFTPAFWEQLGYAADEAPMDRHAFAMLIHPADFPQVQRDSEDFLAGRTTLLDMEFRLRTKPHGWRWIHLRGREIQWTEDGRPHIAAGIVTDVDDFRRVQAAAVEDRERLLLAMQSSGAGIWDWDLRMRRLTDSRCLEMHGLPADLPMPIDEDFALNALDTEFRFANAAAFKRALEGDLTYAAEYSVGQGARWISSLGKAILSDEGKPVRFMGLALDITERKKAENIIEHMRDELLHASRVSAMGAMAATLAHELNQPLTAIANYSTGALRIAASGEDRRLESAMKAVQENAQRAGEIIRRMREMAKGGAVRKEKIEFDRVVKDAARYARAGCEGVTFDLQVDEGFSVGADAVQIQQVLINLMRNACQAMERNDPDDKTVTITAACLPGALQVCVSDRGPGIPREILSTIFEANFSTKAEGMGIGLSISRTIVEAHGGKLWAENMGDGARFCFTLPMAGPN
jgi:two-component system sensor kinase FixL